MLQKVVRGRLLCLTSSGVLRRGIKYFEVLRQVLINFQDGCNIPTPVAIVWSRPHCDKLHKHLTTQRTLYARLAALTVRSYLRTSAIPSQHQNGLHGSIRHGNLGVHIGCRLDVPDTATNKLLLLELEIVH